MPKTKTAVQKDKAKILIVEDHPAAREGLAMRIASQPDLMVCGEAADLAEALHLIATTDPDVVIVDISLKSGNGIDLIKRIKARHNSARMLVWSMHNENLFAERALRVGASGYISKEHATEKIVEAIRHVLDGKLYLSEQLANRLMHLAIGDTAVLERSTLEGLSDREIEVFQLIGQGYGTTQMAAKMRLSPKTVETYRARIKEKMNLGTSLELVQTAIKWTLENSGTQTSV